MTVNNSKWYVALLSIVPAACDSTPVPTTASISAAYVDKMTTSDLYALLRTAPAAPVESLHAVSILSYYRQLVDSSTDDAFVLDGVVISGSHKRLLQAAPEYAALDAAFPNLEAYWQATQTQPFGVVNEAQFAARIKNTFSPSQGSSRLELITPTDVPSNCNINDTDPLVTPDFPTLLSALKPKTEFNYVDTPRGSVYMAPEGGDPTMQAVYAGRYQENFAAAYAAGASHPRSSVRYNGYVGVQYGNSAYYDDSGVLRSGGTICNTYVHGKLHSSVTFGPDGSVAVEGQR